jgi:hypothetical protein
MTMTAFHGDPAIKEKFLARVRAANIVQGMCWNPKTSSGDAIGSILHSAEHAEFPVQLGIPEWLARLVDVIHDNLPHKEFPSWPLQFLEAIPVGRTWDDQLEECFLLFILELFILEQLPTRDATLDMLSNLLQHCLAGSDPMKSVWFYEQTNEQTRDFERKSRMDFTIADCVVAALGFQDVDATSDAAELVAKEVAKIAKAADAADAANLWSADDAAEWDSPEDRAEDTYESTKQAVFKQMRDWLLNILKS